MATVTWNLRPITRRKYAAVQRRFKELYEKKRLRYDDCIAKLMDEFFYDNDATVTRILQTELNEEAPAEQTAEAS